MFSTEPIALCSLWGFLARSRGDASSTELWPYILCQEIRAEASQRIETKAAVL